MAKQTPELFDSGVPRDESAELARFTPTRRRSSRTSSSNPPPNWSEQQVEYRRARAAVAAPPGGADPPELNAAASAWVGKNVPQAYANGIVRADKQIVEVGLKPKGSPFTGGFSVVDERTVKVFARDSALGPEQGRRFHDRRGTARLAHASPSRCWAGRSSTGSSPAGSSKARRWKRSRRSRGAEGDPRRDGADRRQERRHDQLRGEGLRGDGGADADAAGDDDRAARAPGEQRLDLVEHRRPRSSAPTSAPRSSARSSASAARATSIRRSARCPAAPARTRRRRSIRTVPRARVPFVDYLANDKQLRDAVILADAKKLLGMDTSKAQRAFKDLQLHQQTFDDGEGAFASAT
jgi:hypothetical protein